MKELLTSPELEAVAELADAVVSDRSDAAVIAENEAAGRGLDPLWWGRLAETGLLGLCLPESAGGGGLGLDAIAVLAERQGRSQVPGPLSATLLAHRAIATSEVATSEVASPILEELASGAAAATIVVALGQRTSIGRVRAVGTAEVGSRVELSGRGRGVCLVPGERTAYVVVADGVAGPLLALVAPDAEVAATARLQTDRSIAADVDFAATPAVVLGGATAVAELADSVRVAVAATQHGVVTAALGLAATHVAEREQFGRPIGAFQATQHRLADAVIAADALRVSCLHAVRQVAAGAEDGTRASWVAQWWTAAVVPQALLATQHVHGGLGVDITHPIHRTYLWGRRNAVSLGGGLAAERALGDLVAADAMAGAR